MTSSTADEKTVQKKRRMIRKTPKLTNVPSKLAPYQQLSGMTGTPDIGTLYPNIRVFNPLDSKSYDGMYFAWTDLIHTFTHLTKTTATKILNDIPCKYRCKLNVIQDFTEQTHKPICANIVVLGWSGVVSVCSDVRVKPLGGDHLCAWIQDNVSSSSSSSSL